MNKFQKFCSVVALTVSGIAVNLLAHAQAFSVATSTEITNNGGFLTQAYNEIYNALGPTGIVLFLLVTTVLGIIVWMAVKAPRHVVNS